MNYTEDTLVQQTNTNYLEEELGWTLVLAYNNEDFGPNSLLGRASDHEVVLTRPLRVELSELNPKLPDTAYNDAVLQITDILASQTLAATNCEKYPQMREGVQVIFHNNSGCWTSSRGVAPCTRTKERPWMRFLPKTSALPRSGTCPDPSQPSYPSVFLILKKR